jgi:hypothetical protein
VEGIVDERHGKFLVKWQGWPAEDTTWQEAETLENCPDIMAAWRAKKARDQWQWKKKSEGEEAPTARHEGEWEGDKKDEGKGEEKGEWEGEWQGEGEEEGEGEGEGETEGKGEGEGEGEWQGEFEGQGEEAGEGVIREMEEEEEYEVECIMDEVDGQFLIKWLGWPEEVNRGSRRTR